VRGPRENVDGRLDRNSATFSTGSTSGRKGPNGTELREVAGPVILVRSSAQASKRAKQLRNMRLKAQARSNQGYRIEIVVGIDAALRALALFVALVVQQ
jgi:hypothetical protein